ncbi:hypothetical protein [Mycobacteroides salmoniphilum]|uniref:hypothetical protein n=1 Tax=Mycobacteroides salmoniphilum TaxID=404941 RepID=UPI0009927C47|nr:hypothetical protein [Mycobacteroides salmoniphilum]QCH25815.1 hypothetical protein DSM43276_04101 [Mycobacteroides salmoniphilum]
MRIGFFLTLAMITSVLMGACSPAEPESGDRNEVVATVLARIEADLGKPATLDVQKLNIVDGWAFIDSRLQDTDGTHPTGYEGLLRKTGPKWTILESAIGPTDVPWVSWKPKHPDAPAQIWP